MRKGTYVGRAVGSAQGWDTVDIEHTYVLANEVTAKAATEGS